MLYDIALAKQINALVKVAASKGIAPEEAASNMQNVYFHWRKEQENGMIEGIKEKDVKKANKFKLRIGGPWLYVLEYWEDEDPVAGPEWID